jgi:hypothetical protein
MIYTRFGDRIAILADCGEQHPPFLRFPSRLLKVRREVDGREYHQFEFALRADGGLCEIQKTYQAAPKVVLTKNMLQQALMEAE